jgi:hypothetical protein
MSLTSLFPTCGHQLSRQVAGSYGWCLLFSLGRNDSRRPYTLSRIWLAFVAEMSRVLSADLPGSKAILGLVIAHPDQTVSEYSQLLKRRFARCGWAPSLASNTLQAMAKEDRVVCSYEAPEVRSQDRYVAGDKGVEEFNGWMWERPGATPSLRDALYGRIELCRLEHLPRLIELAKEEESISSDLYEQTAVTLARAERKKAEPGPKDHLRDIREVLLEADPLHWSARADRYRTIQHRLEEILAEIDSTGRGLV